MVALCDSAGVPIAVTDSAKPPTLPLTTVLSAMIEPVIAPIQRSETIDRSIPAGTYLPADTPPQEQQESQGRSKDNLDNNTRL